MFREPLALKKSPAMISQQGSDMAFPWKIHEMLDRIERDDKQSIVSWMPSGKSFKVHKREAFSKEILPLYFRHSNFKSFQRNLSIYQFTRIWSGPERGSYQHAHFARGLGHLCTHITRRGAKPTSSPDGSVSRPEERGPRNQHQEPGNYLGDGMLDNDGTSNDMMQEAWNMLSEEDSTESRFVSKSAPSNRTYEGPSLSTGGVQQQNNDSLASNDAKTIEWMLEEGVSTSDLMEIMMGVSNKKSPMPRQSIQAYSDDIISLFSNNEKAMASRTADGAPVVPSASVPSDSRMPATQQWHPSQSRTTDSMMVRLLRTGRKHLDTLPQQPQGASQQLMPLVSLLEEQPFAFPSSTSARSTSTTASVSLMSTMKPNSLGSLGFMDMIDDNDGEPLSLNPWEV